MWQTNPMNKKLINNVSELVLWYIDASQEEWPRSRYDNPESPKQYPLVVIWDIEDNGNATSSLIYEYVYQTDFSS